MLGEVGIVRVAAPDLYCHPLRRRNTHRHSPPPHPAKMVILHFWRFLCSCGLCPTFLASDCRGQPCCPGADSSNPTRLAMLPPQPALSVFCSAARCSSPTWKKHSDSDSATSCGLACSCWGNSPWAASLAPEDSSAASVRLICWLLAIEPAHLAPTPRPHFLLPLQTLGYNAPQH